MGDTSSSGSTQLRLPCPQAPDCVHLPVCLLSSCFAQGCIWGCFCGNGRPPPQEFAPTGGLCSSPWCRHKTATSSRPQMQHGQSAEQIVHLLCTICSGKHGRPTGHHVHAVPKQPTGHGKLSVWHGTSPIHCSGTRRAQKGAMIPSLTRSVCIERSTAKSRKTES